MNAAPSGAGGPHLQDKRECRRNTDCIKEAGALPQLRHRRRVHAGGAASRLCYESLGTCYTQMSILRPLRKEETAQERWAPDKV